MKRFLALWLLSFALIVGIYSCSASNNTITIGSKDFTEQDILGELLAQHIEANTKLKVNRRLHLGGTFICHEAIKAGQIDAYVEYTGTAFTTILKQKAITDPQKVYQQLKQAYAKQFQLEVMPPLGFQNTFAMVIRGDDARAKNLQTISQAAKYTPQWQAGFGYEFSEREDGLPGLSKTYNLKFAKPPKIIDLGLLYQALQQKQVDLVAGNSTDGAIPRLDLVVLTDDKHYFPPYEATPIVRQAALKQHPQLQSAIAQLGGLIDESQMRRLNYQVEGEKRDVKQVVSEFLQAKKLSK